MVRLNNRTQEVLHDELKQLLVRDYTEISDLPENIVSQFREFLRNKRAELDDYAKRDLLSIAGKLRGAQEVESEES